MDRCAVRWRNGDGSVELSGGRMFVGSVHELATNCPEGSRIVVFGHRGRFEEDEPLASSTAVDAEGVCSLDLRTAALRPFFRTGPRLAPAVFPWYLVGPDRSVLGRGSATVHYAPVTFTASGEAVSMRGPRGERGEKGDKGESGAAARLGYVRGEDGTWRTLMTREVDGEQLLVVGDAVTDEEATGLEGIATRVHELDGRVGTIEEAAAGLADFGARLGGVENDLAGRPTDKSVDKAAKAAAESACGAEASARAKDHAESLRRIGLIASALDGVEKVVAARATEKVVLTKGQSRTFSPLALLTDEERALMFRELCGTCVRISLSVTGTSSSSCRYRISYDSRMADEGVGTGKAVSYDFEETVAEADSTVADFTVENTSTSTYSVTVEWSFEIVRRIDAAQLEEVANV